MFTQELLQYALAPRAVVYEPRTGSTNDDAIHWLLEGAPEGAVVIADEQTKGRGRLGRQWVAPPGGALLLSVILRPPRELLTRMSMVGALAVTDMIESYDVTGVDIKWPNDVRIGGRKVSGVLPEAAWEGDRLLGVALGIGVNLNIDFTNAPFPQPATSLGTVLDTQVNRVEALKRLLRRIDHWAQRIGDDGLFAAWHVRLGLGMRATVQQSDSVLVGIAEDAEPDGTLLLRTDDGVLHRVRAGDLLPTPN